MLLAFVMQRYSVYLLATLLLLTSACNRATTATKGRTTQAYVPVPGSVGFDIEPFERGDGSFRLTATYWALMRTRFPERITDPSTTPSTFSSRALSGSVLSVFL